MPQPLKMTSAQMVADAKARIREVDAPEAIEMAQRDDVVIVDLRDPRERERIGYIENAFHCPRGMVEFWVDPDSPYFKPIFGEDKTFIFHCASGWRSAITVATLQDMGMQNVAHITDGFKSWMESGGPIVGPKPKEG
ncbi:MAG: sulfurtransferase [Rhodospirillaceae bacterium]|jgi:rhodanese-related sulfurtransferase|uniref:rhodanese-like domain-containing protein n=1 Tax=Hwanghaeella sp. 1Z406 TaxID=3402811 RepID=UPI000C5389CE|nr:sulfurtransferase [Rhodospirillales bacterium]MAX46996.1 sulfurtransferase [Rhodospirillaceae bacterium]|tara:strand:- start:4216 stop:4626 length:411 start_codon:yes stop_codon:yes gene_type:complete